MTLYVILKNQEKYTLYGVTEYSIEDKKYLKCTYIGKRPEYNYKNEIIKNEAYFMLDAIVGYYINR